MQGPFQGRYGISLRDLGELPDAPVISTHVDWYVGFTNRSALLKSERTYLSGEEIMLQTKPDAASRFGIFMPWLPSGSLQGSIGVDCPQGQQGIKGAAYIFQVDDSLRVWDSVTAAWVNARSIQGPESEVGPAGPAGTQCERGTGWFTGVGAPTVVPGSVPADL